MYVLDQFIYGKPQLTDYRDLDKMWSQMLYRYILRRTLIVSNAKRHKQLQLISHKTRWNAYI